MNKIHLFIATFILTSTVALANPGGIKFTIFVSAIIGFILWLIYSGILILEYKRIINK